MTVSPKSLGGVFFAVASLLSLALSLAWSAPEEAGAAVKFGPKRVAAGGKILVKANKAPRVRMVLLGHQRQPDFSGTAMGRAVLGRLPAGRAKRRFTVPRLLQPGRYFLHVCVGANCRTANGRVVVTRGRTNPSRRFRVRYVHVDRDRADEQVTGPDFTGTSRYRRNFRVVANVPVRGKRGQAPIRYTRAKYRTRANGMWPDPLNPGGFCTGRRVTKLTRTWNGTARVLRLKVRGRRVALDFSPGPIYRQGEPPAEQIRTYWSHDPGCESLDEDRMHVDQLFLGGFAGVHNQADRLKVRTRPEGDLRFVRLNRGWKVFPGRKKGFAQLTLRARQGQNGLWQDRFVIDRLR